VKLFPPFGKSCLTALPAPSLFPSPLGDSLSQREREKGKKEGCFFNSARLNLRREGEGKGRGKGRLKIHPSIIRKLSSLTFVNVCYVKQWLII
jgi:hypothetical protein